MAEDRPVSTDALKTLGTILTDAENGRDAIHLAVLTAIAGQRLKPGESIRLDTDGRAWFQRENGLGIVDPFLLHDIEIGEKFWYVLRPRQITSLRHVWEHPAFPDEVSSNINQSPQTSEDFKKSFEWLKGFAMSAALSYPVLIAAATDWVDNFNTFSEGDSWRHEGREVPDEFWYHYERVTGKFVPMDVRQSFFSCPC